MIKHKAGNLITMAEAGEFDIIVHGCNCFNTMGSGIAREIKAKYPEAYVADTRYGKAGDYDKLGKFSFAAVKMDPDKPFMIANAYTQFEFGQTAEKPDLFEYTSFDMILQKLLHFHGHLRFGFPYIGMGLAGGDRGRILDMLESFSDHVNALGGTVTLVEFA